MTHKLKKCVFHETNHISSPLCPTDLKIAVITAIIINYFQKKFQKFWRQIWVIRATLLKISINVSFTFIETFFISRIWNLFHWRTWKFKYNSLNFLVLDFCFKNYLTIQIHNLLLFCFCKNVILLRLSNWERITLQKLYLDVTYKIIMFMFCCNFF